MASMIESAALKTSFFHVRSMKQAASSMRRWTTAAGFAQISEWPALRGYQLRGCVATHLRRNSPSGLVCSTVTSQRNGQEKALHICAAAPAVAQDYRSRTPTAHSSRTFDEDMYDADGRLMLKNLSYSELVEWCEAIGESPRRAHQLWRWMYYDRKWLPDFRSAVGAQDGFSVAFAEKASRLATLEGGLQCQSINEASDGTRKLVFSLTGEGQSQMLVEAVLIPIVRRGGQRARTTLCISSQVGCAQNCQFCFTGRMGLLANLSTAQIVEQVVVARRLAAELGLDRTAPVTNLVFMGMGEPLANMAAVLRSIPILTHPHGLHFSHNKITVSTVGLVPEMRQVAAQTSVQLALSLHATTDEVRNWIAPINRKYPLKVLIPAVRELFPEGATPGPHGRHVLIEYVMLRGVNDSLEDAARLLQLLQGIQAKVNLIVFNPFDQTQFRPSLPDQVQAFRSVLIQGGRVCTVRDSRGDDQMAACGQLGFLDLQGPRAPMLKVPARLKEELGLGV